MKIKEKYRKCKCCNHIIFGRDGWGWDKIQCERSKKRFFYNRVYPDDICPAFQLGDLYKDEAYED